MHPGNANQLIVLQTEFYVTETRSWRKLKWSSGLYAFFQEESIFSHMIHLSVPQMALSQDKVISDISSLLYSILYSILL